MLSETLSRIFLVCFSFSVFSCSVKEDRRDCPVLLQVAIPAQPSLNQDVLVSSMSGDVNIRQYYYPGVSDSLLRFYLPKGQLYVYGVTAMNNCYAEGGKIRCKPGHQYDSLFSYANVIAAYGEYASDLLVLHKQYAEMVFDLSAILDENVCCDVFVRGGYCGLDIDTGLPLVCPYYVLCDSLDDTHFSIRVPRQGDDSLELILKLSDGREIVYPIGASLKQSGFDWYAENLDDAFIEIMTVEAGVAITVMDWETGFVKYAEI